MTDTPAKTDAAADPKASDVRRRPLYRRFRQGPTWWETIRGWWPWIFVLSILVAVGWMFVKPAPPNTVLIATGPADGSYHWFAQKYAKTFAEEGITLELRPS